MRQLLVLSAALALFGAPGCAMHSVQITTNVFELPEDEQPAAVIQGLGIYIHAAGRTLAIAGPVVLDIKCRTFGKDSTVAIEWGGMTYVCEGGQLSPEARKLLGEVARGAVAGATGNPLGLLQGGLRKAQGEKLTEEAP